MVKVADACLIILSGLLIASEIYRNLAFTAAYHFPFHETSPSPRVLPCLGCQHHGLGSGPVPPPRSGTRGWVGLVHTYLRDDSSFSLMHFRYGYTGQERHIILDEMRVLHHSRRNYN